MIPTFRTLLGAALLAAVLPSCKDKPRSGAATSSGPAQPASAPPRAAPSPPASAAAPAVGCRAIQVTGDIKLNGRALRTGAWLDGTSWLRLPKDGKIVVKHPSSARELALSGPARALLCAGGDEHVVIAEGTLRTTAGPGARPGAEVRLFTPVGIIRYGDADLEARVGGRAVNMQVFAGDAWVEPLFGATRLGPEHVLPKGKATLKVAAAPAPARAVTACREASEAAARAAEAVLSPGEAGASLGQRAAIQLKARQTAAALCGSARAVLGNVREEASARELEIRINEADALWQKVPVAPAAPSEP